MIRALASCVVESVSRRLRSIGGGGDKPGNLLTRARRSSGRMGNARVAIEHLEDRLLLSHSSGSPFLGSEGVLVAELDDANDTVLIEPLGAESIQITINGDVHEYLRGDVLGINVTAGGGDDRVEVSSALDIPAVLVGGAGSDTLIGGAVADVLDGGPDADSLVGDDGDDVLIAEPFDSLDGGPGIDSLTLTIAGTDGADSVRIENVDDVTTRVTINGLPYDFVRYEFASVQVFAGAGDDLIEILPDVTVNANVFGESGDDTLIGGAGNDSLNGDDDADSFAAGGGDDVIFAEHSEAIDGGDGDNLLHLSVGGTELADAIQVANLDAMTVRITVNGSPFDFPRSDLVSVEVAAGADNDVVEFAGDVEFVGAIFGGDGDDALAGGPNADTIDGGAGNDSITGGDGGDAVFGSDGLDTIDGGAGDDAVEGGLDNDSLAGGDGLDTILGDDGSDTISGGDGDDVLSGGLPEGYGTDLVDGADLVQGGLGNDTIFGAAGADTLDGGAGNDSLNGGVDADSLSGGDGDDRISGGSEADTLSGGAGDDVLDGGVGIDSIDGGLDFDVLQVVGSDDAETITAAPDGSVNIAVSVGAETDVASLIDYLDIAGLGGNDSITIDELLELDAALDGGDGDDTLTGGHGSDILSGGAGSDSLIGRDGFDTARFLGTEQDDLITLSADEFGLLQISLGAEIDAAEGVEQLFVNAAGGNDSIIATFDALVAEVTLWLEGRGGDDTLVGGPWSDFLYGGGGADVLDGRSGDDTLYAGSGDDTLTGGSGNDFILGTTGDDSIDGGEGFDTITGGDGFDTITGDFGDDSIDGGADDDTIDGGDGLDSIVGGDGDDSIDGGDGFDSIVGGEGDDTLDGQTGNDWVFGGLGNDRISGGDGNDTLGSNEGDDLFFGGNGDDQISGGADDDVLDGGEGADLLDGGTGRDRLLGGDRSRPRAQRDGCDNDTLVGAAGDDSLDGGRGRDFLDGGDGTNDLTADLSRDTVVPALGLNRITQIQKSDRGCSDGVLRSARGLRHPNRGPRHSNRDPRLNDFLLQLSRRLAELQSATPPNPPPVIASHQGNVNGTANISLSLVTDLVSLPSAQQLIYTLTVRNFGPKRAYHVTVYDTFPETFAILGVVANRANGDPVQCPISLTNDAICDFGNIHDDGSTATATVTGVADGSGTMQDTALGTSQTPLTDRSDDSVTTSTQVTTALVGVTIHVIDGVATELAGNGAVLQVRREQWAAAPPLTVNFIVSDDGDALPDFTRTPTGGSVIIPGNSCCEFITISPLPDNLTEGKETFTITLSDGFGYSTSSPHEARFDIRDHQTLVPYVSVARDPSLPGTAETAEGISYARFVVTSYPAVPREVTVYYTVRLDVPNAATPIDDYIPLSGSVRIAANTTTAEIRVGPRNDSLYEPLEYVTIRLNESADYLAGGSTEDSVTIYSEDVGPDTVRIRASDPEAREQGQNTGRFDVCREQTDTTLAVNYSTTEPPGSSATSPGDYTLQPAQLQIADGSKCASLTVVPNDDSELNELPETVVVTVVAGSGYVPAFPPAHQATVTIFDNDCSPVRIRSLTHNDADGIIYAGDNFTLVARTRPSSPPSGHGDYTWDFRPLLPSAGTSRRYAPWQASTGTKNNNTFATIAGELGQYRATLVSCGVSSSAFLTLQVAPTISISDVVIQEPIIGTTVANFTVSLSHRTSEDVTVEFRTVDLTANAPWDYAPRPRATLTIPRGTTTQTVSVQIQSDVHTEPVETFLVLLSNPSRNATIADGEGVGTIVEKCVCLARVQFGAQFAVASLDGIAEKWPQMSLAQQAALKPIILGPLTAFAKRQLGEDVGTEFAARFDVLGMLKLYQEIVEFGWKVEYADLHYYNSFVEEFRPGPAYKLKEPPQKIQINTTSSVDNLDGSVRSTTTPAQRAIAVNSALSEMTTYTSENAAAQTYIRSNRETLISAVERKLWLRKSDYLAAARINTPTANTEGFDCAARQLATAYVDGVLMFLKMHWGARPAQGTRTDEETQNRFNRPWCADWRAFFQGEGGHISSYWRGLQCSEINTYFQLIDAQWHNHTSTVFHSEHNFVVVAPVLPVVPQLRYSLNPNDPLPLNKVVPDPADTIWPFSTLKSTDPRIVILDPWILLLPMAYDVTNHDYGVTNQGSYRP